MKEFFIINPFQFLSYEITFQLLEKGYSVHYQNMIAKFDLEKEFMIGRNSNFQQHTHLTDELLERENLHIILPIYDFLFHKEFSADLDYSEIIHVNPSKGGQPLTIIAPFSLYQQVIANQEKLQKLTSGLQIIFIPTLYGKYQPTNSLFCEVMKNHSITDRELSNTLDFHNDALHISAAVSEIIGIMNKKQTGIFLLKNMDEKRLTNCLFTIIGRKVSLLALGDTFRGEEILVQDTRDYVSIINELKKEIVGEIVR